MAIRKANGYYERDRNKIDKEPSPTFEQRAEKVQVVRRGRRIRLTEELIQVYGRVYNQGTQEMACSAIGMSVRTVQDWIDKAREEDCDDELLMLLRDTHDAVTHGGNRAAMFKLNMEHAVDDPKTAVEMMKIMIPSANPVKTFKADIKVTAQKAPDTSHLEGMSDEEILILDALERARAKRLGSGA